MTNSSWQLAALAYSFVGAVINRRRLRLSRTENVCVNVALYTHREGLQCSVRPNVFRHRVVRLTYDGVVQTSAGQLLSGSQQTVASCIRALLGVNYS